MSVHPRQYCKSEYLCDHCSFVIINAACASAAQKLRPLILAACRVWGSSTAGSCRGCYLQATAAATHIRGDALKKSSPGVYTATVTAGNTEETTAVTATVYDAVQTKLDVSAVADSPDHGQSLIATDHYTYVSGTDIHITVTLRDSNKKPLTGDAGLLTGRAPG